MRDAFIILSITQTSGIPIECVAPDREHKITDYLYGVHSTDNAHTVVGAPQTAGRGVQHNILSANHRFHSW